MLVPYGHLAQVLSDTKIFPEGKQTFPKTAHDEHREPKINLSNPDLIRARVVDDQVIVPAVWRDDDEDDAMPAKRLSD